MSKYIPKKIVNTDTQFAELSEITQKGNAIKILLDMLIEMCPPDSPVARSFINMRAMPRPMLIVMFQSISDTIIKMAEAKLNEAIPSTPTPGGNDGPTVSGDEVFGESSEDETIH